MSNMSALSITPLSIRPVAKDSVLCKIVLLNVHLGILEVYPIHEQARVSIKLLTNSLCAPNGNLHDQDLNQMLLVGKAR